MDIAALHERIRRGMKTVMVACWKNQSKPENFGQVKLYDLSRADRRAVAQHIEENEYERVVGYFNHRVSLEDFTAACEAQCCKVREIEDYAESLLRFSGTESSDHGILTDEYIASLMDAGDWGAPDTDSGYAGEAESDWGIDSAVTEGANPGSDSEIRALPGCKGQDRGEQGESGNARDKLGYL